MQERGWLPWCAAMFAVLSPSIAPASAWADALGPEERLAIDRRLVKVVEGSAVLSIEEGDTVLVERQEIVSKSRFTKKLGDYEGMVGSIVAPKGVVVEPRLDEFKLTPQGDKMAVMMRYAVHLEPGTAGGRVQLTLGLVERTGLGNVVVQAKMSHAVNVTAAKVKPQDLTADFYGYRHHAKLTKEWLSGLAAQGVRGLSSAEDGKIPPLDRVSAEVAASVYQFERDRRRMWIAHRHLVAARANKNEKVAAAAKAYLANLDKADGELKGLPDVALVEGKGAKAGADERPAKETKAGEGATLKPERVESAQGKDGKGADGKGAKAGGKLNPLSTYEPGSEGDEDEPIGEPTPREEVKDKPKEGEKDKAAKEPVKGDAERKETAGGGVDETDFLEGRKAREVPIPSFARSLVLDDPNIAHTFSVRLSYASLRLAGTTAAAPAIFYSGSVAVTRTFGLELTVPTAYVSVDVQRAQALYTMGNPLLSAKYRVYLPAVEGRQPALTLRARWGVPISPLNTIPPTQLGAEDFSFPAHFTDTYAFLLEKTDLGLGVNAAWQYGMLYTGCQVYGDYFLPVSTALDQTKFPTMSYGASVGVLPLADLLGVYLEGRATTLMTGPTRTEFFTYLGARVHFLDHLEAAAWGSLPIGSIGRASGLQLGLELRFAYDVPDAITLSPGPRGREELLRD